MKGIHRLTEARVRTWVAAPKKDDPQLKLPDGGGLNLVRLPAGGASWQVRYRVAGAEKTYSIGPSNVVSLADARKQHATVKEALAAGKDPMQQRQLARAAEVASSGELFENVMGEWLDKQKLEWGDYHYDKSKKALERHVAPKLGKLPFRDIPPAVVAKVIQNIQGAHKRETAAKILRHVRAIFRLGCAKGMRADNPADAVVEILAKAKPVKHRAALLTPEGVGEVLRTVRDAALSPAVRMCHILIAYTIVRIANAVSARAEEFDLDSLPAMWVIPRARMKMKDREHDHKVILAPELVTELKAYLASIGNPTSGYLFPGQQGRKGKFITREAVEQPLLELGFRDRHTCHGWRSSFSTMTKDNEFDEKAVDLALDHVHDNTVARAYDRGERLAKRVKLMAWWGALLTEAAARPA